MPLQIEQAESEAVMRVLDRELPGPEVRAFGSRLSGAALRPDSDLDIVLMAKHPISLERMVNAERSLAGLGLPYPVDLFDWAKLPPDFQHTVEKEFVVLREQA